MSTRSGKRLHSTFHEEDEEMTVPKAKKRTNYVRYPSRDRKTVDEAVPEVKSTRKQKKNTLKEKNSNIPDSDMVDLVDSQNTARVTRRTRRFVENPDAAESSDLNSEPLATASKGKSKKSKKKKSKNSSLNKVENNDPKDGSVKSKKKKKGKKSGSPKEKPEKVKHNSSNVSTDSFHSAADSPLFCSMTPLSQKKNKLKNVKITDTETCKDAHLNGTFEKTPRKSRNSSMKNNSFDKEAGQISDDNIDENTQHVKAAEKCDNVHINDIFETTSTKTRNSSIKNNTFDKEASQISEDNSAIYENNPENHNATFDKDTRRKSSRLSVIDNNNSVVLNSTFEKPNLSKTASLDTTYDKNDSKLNSSYKQNQKTNSQKSSLISSDTSNLTYDKADRISVTSDESQQYNIVNTTPVLVESSMDESALSVEQEEGTKSKSLEKQPPAPLKREGTFTKESEPVTPLKREGTFTKESPVVQKPVQLSTQQMSLPSPGCTPFHLSRSSQKPALNVTRSIEKSQGSVSRSSLAEPILSRQTRVMFCSPANNPAMLTQQKKTVIKSSIKGSNKSFVVQDTARSSLTAGVKRSRSAAGGGAGGAGGAPGAKRARPLPAHTAAARTPGLNGPVNPPTPPRGRSTGPPPPPPRTRLPDFASLHRAAFALMESLPDCQQRRLQRARRLRTPTAPMQVLQRASPQVPPTQANKPPKKTVTPSKEPKLPTLMSLKPGFTRFGFKMDTPHENPFTMPAKTEKKKEKRNGMTTRSTLPAKIVLPVVKNKIPQLNGARKEVAKQTVMREKSFTSLSGKREAKRDENRTIIKGVRTNRRFDLQMKMRNIE